MKNYIVDDMEVLADDIIFELASQSTEFKNISVIGHYEDIEPKSPRGRYTLIKK